MNQKIRKPVSRSAIQSSFSDSLPTESASQWKGVRLVIKTASIKRQGINSRIASTAKRQIESERMRNFNGSLMKASPKVLKTKSNCSEIFIFNLKLNCLSILFDFILFMAGGLFRQPLSHCCMKV